MDPNGERGDSVDRAALFRQSHAEGIRLAYVCSRLARVGEGPVGFTLHWSMFHAHGTWTIGDLRLAAIVPVAVAMKATRKTVALEQRFIAFASDVMALSTMLPNTRQGRHISGQILRSGTATASNYGEVRGAESRSEFVHKLGIVLKELNETVIWLELIERTSILVSPEVARLLAENRELCRIITASIKTVRGSTDR
jgi:four helix bundle protein